MMSSALALCCAPEPGQTSDGHMPAPTPDTRAPLEWLGFIQPNGLVVSAPAPVEAGAILNRRDAEGQSRLAACVRERGLDPVRGPEPLPPGLPRARRHRPRPGRTAPDLPEATIGESSGGKGWV